MEKIASSAARLKEAMNAAGKKQADLVRDLDMNKSAVSRYLSGEYEPKQDAVLKMAAYLGVTEMWLWGYDVPKERPSSAKKNDKLAELVVKMRSDNRFFQTVEALAGLTDEQFDLVDRLLANFFNK